MTLLLGSPFPVPQIPQAAYLRSWFCNADGVANVRAAHDLLGILRALNPRAARRAENLSPRLIYVQILHDCAHRFPIQEYVTFSVENEWDDEEAVGALDVLPVSPAGFDYDDDMPPALVVCGLLHNWLVFAEEYQAGMALLEAQAWLNAYAPIIGDERVGARRFEMNVTEPPRPPRGRVWRKPWDAVPDAFEYANACTGNPFLDYDINSMDEVGWDMYPRLTLDEIRASEAQWRLARPMLDDIQKLIDYIGTRPARLRLLADALLRKPDALREITLPKNGTLAQSFRRGSLSA